jgi:sulfide:quinone oxidoreductase
MKRVVILGGGSGGVVAASRLSKWSEVGEVETVLVDRSPWHEYRPSYLWVMTGKRRPEEVRRPLSVLEQRYGTRVVQASVTRIDPDERTVATDAGDFEYDYLIVSLGSIVKQDPRLAGLEAPWELDQALEARGRLAGFGGGRVAVGVSSWPYRCPPAPFEMAFMLRYLAEQRNVSRTTEITVFHTWEKAMEVFGPAMVEGFTGFLRDYRVGFEGSFELQSHDPANRTLTAADGRVLDYDLAVVVPPHEAPPVIRESGLAAASGYMDVDLPSMESPRHPDVFGIGDSVAPSIGLGMAGVFAHFQAEHVVSEILDRIRGAYVGELYNMVGVCVMDCGYMGAAVWCDFTDKLFGRSETPDCRMLGGMRAFRAVKSAFERYWFANLFGPDQGGSS